MNTMIFFVPVVYLIGAIPSGYWLCRIFFNIDITIHGSGNIGSTNVARLLGATWFFWVFILDAGKAFFALYLVAFLARINGQALSMFQMTVLAMVVIIGNGYSVFLRFRGGKGVATSLGLLAFLAPFLFFLFLGVFLPLVIWWRRVDFAALASFVLVLLFSLSLVCFNFCCPGLCGLLLFIVGWVFFRHYNNIKRMLCYGE